MVVFPSLTMFILLLVVTFLVSYHILLTLPLKSSIAS